MKNLYLIPLFSLILLCSVSKAQSTSTVLGPYKFYYSDQNPVDVTIPILQGFANGCADEGRFVNIVPTDVTGPIHVTPNSAAIMGPPCPAYDAHGNRIPAAVQPPNCQNFTGTVTLDKQPATGSMQQAQFTCQDKGYWTRCSENKQYQFPQTVTVQFEFYGIDCRVVPDTIVCDNGQAMLSATIYPYGGTLTWNTPFGNFTGNNLTVPLPGNFVTGMVTATYSIGGATKSSTGIIKVGKLVKFTLPACVTTTDVTQTAATTASAANLTFDMVCHPAVVFILE